MRQNLKFFVLCLLTAFLTNGCQQVQNLTKPATVAPATLRDVPAQRLGYRFEPDALAPPEVQQTAAAPQPEKLTAVQNDFDQNRPTNALVRTILSPDKQRALAIYQNIGEEGADFRLDLYEASGKLIRKITPDTLALRFPDAAVWSPDGANAAFVAARRLNVAASQEIVQEAPRPPELETDTPAPTDANANAAASPVAAPSPATAASVLTFRTEQVYSFNRDGGELKPLTQTDGLIYFYLAWSPDGSMLAALGCRENEWKLVELRAQQEGLMFKPLGRPRLLEKNGRERRLDDGLTGVYPVWSPDSSKVAVGFDKQVRIYDAIGNNPTAASMPLQVPLLISSKICDQKVEANQQCTGATATDANANSQQQLPTTEPVTFLPIVALKWTEDATLFLQTGFFKDYSEGESVRSYPRWHRLALSPQPVNLR